MRGTGRDMFPAFRLPVLTRLLVAVAALATWLPSALTGHAAAATAVSASRLVFDSNRTGNYEIFSMGFDGAAPQRLTTDTRFDSWWPRLSPDRTQILFYRTPAGTHDRDFAKTSLWEMAADGTGVHQVIANGANQWQLQGHAMWSPSGTQLVMFAGSSSNPQIWVTNADGSAPRQVTARPGTNVDPSWDASGSSLLFIGCPVAACVGASYEVYRVSTDGKTYQRLTSDAARDQDPAASPDGRAIAWLRQTTAPSWGIYAMNADGSGQHRVVADLQVNSKPAWSDDGSWVFFHRLAAGQTSFGIWRVHPDGTQMSEIDGHALVGPSPYANEYPDAGVF